MSDTTKTPSHRNQVLIKFLLLMALLVGYFAYLSIKFGLLTGGVAAALTWSFFVLCTPIADAGFLLDFPLRLLFGIRMLVSEIVVWGIAIGMNLYAVFLAPQYYETTFLTQLMHQIITHPYPYWGIVILSGIGTFLSVQIGDELMDVIHHRDRKFFHSHAFKHELIMVAFFLFALLCYSLLMKELGVEITHK